MAKMREVSVSVGRTINMGNYESLRVERSGAATLESGDDRDEVVSDISDWLKTQVRHLVSEHSRDMKKG
jgi:hypothetical protein